MLPYIIMDLPVLCGDKALSSNLVLKMPNKADFKDFKAMKENRLFQPVNFSLSSVNKKIF